MTRNNRLQPLQQANRLILHLVNLNSAGNWFQPTDEFIQVGPVKVGIKLPEAVTDKKLKLLVSDQKISSNLENGWIRFTISSISDFTVVVIT